MTCEWCLGKLEIYLLDVWAFTRAKATGIPVAPGLIPKIGPIPCPKCKTEDSLGVLLALLDKHGQPFDDLPVTGFEHWSGPDGTPLANVTAKRPEVGGFNRGM